MNEKSFDFCSIVGGYVTDYIKNPREFLIKACEKYEKTKANIKNRDDNER